LLKSPEQDSGFNRRSCPLQDRRLSENNVPTAWMLAPLLQGEDLMTERKQKTQKRRARTYGHIHAVPGN